ncbi:hypothetical protein BD410DRAFT_843911 [Rickenella mellea]|uniref:Uncharacterized protein n=1 Tax=Rickenella mellea TaxID=50990 RepID=A0A4Y7PRA4_9AGAM|nr:hypothetical protein BD410DRAFT_843911 [Rickenella mellea]
MKVVGVVPNVAPQLRRTRTAARKGKFDRLLPFNHHHQRALPPLPLTFSPPTPVDVPHELRDVDPSLTSLSPRGSTVSCGTDDMGGTRDLAQPRDLRASNPSRSHRRPGRAIGTQPGYPGFPGGQMLIQAQALARPTDSLCHTTYLDTHHFHSHREVRQERLFAAERTPTAGLTWAAIASTHERHPASSTE